ncbi:TonB-dependent receptor [Pseudoalteromonas citrea]|uniref:TonB-dependent receptor n=1 Tax=Pseudoalteromonas citrea TaxID=43655 RepID=A0A5S3XIH3_9GAMM|nr:TonB-dependent receptor [Pseudoalteromonas citrea]TMP45423.1 TonB-dependent receptor [Pseudoalteromonas citrea]TMP53666.1 TonB-dependent receptor [Pseudoalteromonas citrea]
MSMFKPSMLTLAFIGAGVVSHTAYATQEKKVDSGKKVEVIEVKGFRASVIESINTKRFSSEVVESISAEDIGKLPDSSIAESIARLPGLTAQRLDGRASKVSIRGFGENESATTFNGREQVSISDNRGVEFDLYPSEIMSGVTVYKTPSARLEAEGIAGVIDMQTVKPLSVDDRVVQVNGQYEQTSFDKLNPDGNDDGFRGTVSYIDKFADDTIGVAVALSTMTSPNQEKRWNAWGYPEFEGSDGKQYSILGGAKPFVRSSTLERDSAMLVLEAAPNDQLSMVFDALYVDFKDEKILRGIEIPFAWGQGTIAASSATIDSESGFISSAVTQGQRVVLRNDYEDREAELTSFGFNAQYNVTESLSLEFDASHSNVEKKIWSLESYSGTGRGDNRGAADNIGYTFSSDNTGALFTHELDYSDYNLIKIGGPLSWGASSVLNDTYGVSGTEYENQLQDGFINAPTVEDELNALKLAAKQVLDGDHIGSVEFGLSYKEREKVKRSEGYFMTLNDFSYPDNTGLLSVPEEYRLGTASLGFIGMGDMIAYDSRAMVADGKYSLLAESLTKQDHATKSWGVEEQVTAAYVQANIDSNIASLALTGNVGVRYVKTQINTKGSIANPDASGRIILEQNNVSHDYSHVLPSLNLSLAVDDTQTVRFGIAKTLSRPRMDEMNSSVARSYRETPDSNGNNWEIKGGNPLLEPKEAVGIDLTYENYFSAEGYFSVALFQKNLDVWIFDGTTEVDLTGVVNAATGEVPANPTATQSFKVNGGDGDLWGYELSVALPFNVFHDSLDGFGMIASHTGVKQDVKDQFGKEYKLPGLSEKIQSFTLYYENHGFQARTSMRKRSDFKGDINGPGFDGILVDILGETIWDAQLGYDFAEGGFDALAGLTVSLQVQNITEEPFTSLSGDNALHVRDYQDYGRTYLLGFGYKF